MKMDEGPPPKFELEMRRGVLVLAVLSQLRRPQYGYSLRQALTQQNLPIEEGTLYPLLRRLESQGHLISEWRTDDGQPRRYYQLNAQGEILLKQLTQSWNALNASLTCLLKEETP